MPKIIKNGIDYCNTPGALRQASEILYDNSESNLISETVQSAIGELSENMQNSVNEVSEDLNNLMSSKLFSSRSECGDANAINQSGVYLLTSKSTNTNGNTNGLLISFALADGVLFQWIMRYDGCIQFMRMNWYGSWKDWQRNVIKENFSYSNGTLNITI